MSSIEEEGQLESWDFEKEGEGELNGESLHEDTLEATAKLCPLDMYEDNESGNRKYEQCLKDVVVLIESKKNSETTIQAQQIGLAVGLPTVGAAGAGAVIGLPLLAKLLKGVFTRS